jgi:hypothetical protein
MKFVKLLFLIFFLFANANLFGKMLALSDTSYVLKGRTISAEDGKALPSVTIRVADIDRGTFSNSLGEFKLKLPRGKHTLLFSMIGHEQKIVEIDLQSEIAGFETELAESSLMTGEVVVIAEDPGAQLMRRAIKLKLNKKDSIENYTYMLYTKFVASSDTISAGRKVDDTDTTIVSILESYSKGYYAEPDRFYNEIIQKRQSVNVPPQANFVAFGTNVNAYDDFVQILSEQIHTPFHPDAPDFYDFILDTNYRHPENRDLARIIAMPGTGARKMFTGFVFLDTSSLTPVEVELSPNNAVRLPFDAELKYRQNFTIAQGHCVPAKMDVYSTLDAEFLWIFAPRLDVHIQTVAYDFRINDDFDYGIFQGRPVEIAEKADKFDSTFWEKNELIPLSDKEIQAYDVIRMTRENPDSVLKTTLLSRIFGPVNRFFANLSKPPFTGIEDFFAYNRVHGPYLGGGIYGRIYGPFSGRALLGYGFADERANIELELKAFLDDKDRFNFYGKAYSKLDRSDNDWVIQKPAISALSFLFNNDYGDYYYNEGFELGFEASSGQLRFIKRELFERPKSIRLFAKHEKHTTAIKNTDFALLGFNSEFRENPAAVEGTLNSYGFEINWNYNKLRRLENLGFHLSGEFSNPDIIDSDFNYERYYAAMNWRTRTLPLWRLDLRVSAGYSRGYLPQQKFFSLESSISGVAGQSSFRGMDVKEFYGDRYAAVSFEHSFGEIVPGLFRIPNVASLGLEFILFGNVGYSDFTENAILAETPGKSVFPLSTDATRDGYYYEAGIGVNRILIFFRFDATVRMSQVDTPRFFLTLSGATF